MLIIVLAAAGVLVLVVVVAVFLATGRRGMERRAIADGERAFPDMPPFRAPPSNKGSRVTPADHVSTAPVSDEALRELEEQFRRSPSDVATLTRLALAYFGRDELQHAQRSFRALLLQRLDGAPISKAEVFCYLGEISERQGDRGKAINMLERAVEHDPALARASLLLARLKAG